MRVVLSSFLILIFQLVFLLDDSKAQIPEVYDCTQDSGPVFASDELVAASQGSLSEGGFTLSTGGSPVSPDIPIVATVGVDIRFLLERPDPLFDGYLVRVANMMGPDPFAFFVQDSADVGIASFCSALGLLVSLENAH